MARALRMRGKSRNVPGATGKTASALQALKGMLGSPNSSPVPPGPPQSLGGPSEPLPAPSPEGPPNMNVQPGATDGLGAGQGGLAIHPTLKQAKIAAYEPRHSSKHR
jgi:hypothetical protein